MKRLILIALLLLTGTASAAVLVDVKDPAKALDPSGHWEGVFHLEPRGRDSKFAMDVMRLDGRLTGSFDTLQIPWPMPMNVTVQGRSIVFAIHDRSPDGRKIEGTLSADGNSISGELNNGRVTFGFTLTRTGVARGPGRYPSPPIPTAMEGIWTGTYDSHWGPRTVLLKITNHRDGTSTGSVVVADSAVEADVTRITNKGANLTLEIKDAQAGFVGTLSADGTELSGKWTQEKTVVLLTFRHAAAK